MRKMRAQRMNCFAPNYIATWWWSQRLNQHYPTAKFSFLVTVLTWGFRQLSDLGSTPYFRREGAEALWVKGLCAVTPCVFTNRLRFVSTLPLQTREKLDWAFWMCLSLSKGVSSANLGIFMSCRVES